MAPRLPRTGQIRVRRLVRFGESPSRAGCASPERLLRGRIQHVIEFEQGGPHPVNEPLDVLRPRYAIGA